MEFIGTPGSGKTTIARRLVAAFRADGLRAGTMIQLSRGVAARTMLGRTVAGLPAGRFRRAFLWVVFYLAGSLSVAGFVREHPRLARSVLQYQLARALPAPMKRHILYWFFQLGGRHRLLASGSVPTRLVVIDDGFLHRAVQLHVSHLEVPERRPIERYVDLVPEPDLVVWVRADRTVCERRVLDRGVWHHSRSLTAQQLSTYITNAEGAVGLAVERARARGWLVISVDNDDNRREPSIESIVAAVERLVDHSRGRVQIAASGVGG